MQQTATLNTIKLKDKTFRRYLEHQDILSRIGELAHKLDETYRDNPPVFLGVLNGCFMFATDLMKAVSFHCQITFIKLASYEKDRSTGRVQTLIGLHEALKQEIAGRDIVIIEDIVDTGRTIKALKRNLHAYKPRDIKILTLLLKPAALQEEVRIDYTGFEIPNDFVVGYGLDYDGWGRNLKDIYKAV